MPLAQGGQFGQVGPIIDTVAAVVRASIVPFAVLLVGLVAGYLLGRLVRRLLVSIGVPDAVEGTPFERTARRFGTSTVGLLSGLVGLAVYILTLGVALELTGLLRAQQYSVLLRTYLSQVFVAVLVLILGFIIGDKAALATQERLEGVKLSQVSLLPPLVKYTILFVAVLVALSQLRVATTPLVVLLLIYGLALIVFGGLAFYPLLAAGGAGMYLILTQPYSIGDKIEIDGHRGIVQEFDVFVTRVENESEEFIVPNHRVFKSGIVRIRD